MSRYRRIVLPEFTRDLFTVKFILGMPAPVSAVELSHNGTESEEEREVARQLQAEREQERTDLIAEVEQEMLEHQDMVLLNVGPASPTFHPVKRELTRR